MEEVRVRNNTLWMDLLRIALEADPVRTKEVIAGIREADTEITRIWKEIARDSDPPKLCRNCGHDVAAHAMGDAYDADLVTCPKFEPA